MARLVGNQGNVAIGSLYNITANAWSMTISRVVSDTTAYGDSSSSFVGGVPTYSGSISGFLSSTSAPGFSATNFETDDSPLITLEVDDANNRQWSGNAVVTNVSIGTSKTGDTTVSLDFNFTGTVTEAGW